MTIPISSVPARLAYDIDGTRVFTLGPLTEYTDLERLNNEESDATTNAERLFTWIILFPALRDVRSVMIYTDGGGTFTVSGSSDTTTGEDGTWENEQTLNNSETFLDYRTRTRLYTFDNCRALKLESIGASGTSGIQMLHVGGYIGRGPDHTESFDTHSSGDVLIVYDATLDSPILDSTLDYGVTIRGSSEDRLFRVKNLSNALTADNVVVELEALTDASPSVPAQHLVSVSGRPAYSEEDTSSVLPGNYYATISLGAMPPQAESSPLSLRRVTYSLAQLGIWAWRIKVSSDSWSAEHLPVIES